MGLGYGVDGVNTQKILAYGKGEREEETYRGWGKERKRGMGREHVPTRFLFPGICQREADPVSLARLTCWRVVCGNRTTVLVPSIIQDYITTCCAEALILLELLGRCVGVLPEDRCLESAAESIQSDRTIIYMDERTCLSVTSEATSFEPTV